MTSELYQMSEEMKKWVKFIDKKKEKKKGYISVKEKNYSYREI